MDSPTTMSSRQGGKSKPERTKAEEDEDTKAFKGKQKAAPAAAKDRGER